jgi:hypothetical protein
MRGLRDQTFSLDASELMFLIRYLFTILKHQNKLAKQVKAYVYLRPMKQTDRLLKIGQKLEKEGLGSFKTTTPSGTPVYYRANGLQIIPSEAEEIDTNNRCQVIITREAAALSGLIMATLRILGQGNDGQRRSSAAIAQFKLVLSNRKCEEWEHTAAKDIITASLKFADIPFPAPSKPNEWGDPDDFGEHIMRRYINRRRIKDNQDDNDDSQESPFKHEHVDPFTGLPEQGPSQDTRTDSGVWSEIRGVMGVELAQYWIPVSFPSRSTTRKEQQAILRTIVRRGLKPEIAMTIIANRAKDLKGQS